MLLTSHVPLSASLRFELGDTHTYDYVEGTIPWPIAPGTFKEISAYFPADNEYFAYFDPGKPSTLINAMDQLESFITREGPYDAILAYSHGTQLVGSLLDRWNTRAAGTEPFKCAVFLSGGIPYDFRSLPDASHLDHLDPVRRGVCIHIPVANIWGKNDETHPGTSAVLSALCRQDLNTVFVHSGGHEIPGSKDRQGLLGCVKAIRRTIDLAASI
ncbi:hypothetical protein HIM_02273 [Hirsutella minnesotensis 3608]|nr:hypothetical protein HIM_02273 [Hirsutella minnesotensis 3608]